MQVAELETVLTPPYKQYRQVSSFGKNGEALNKVAAIGIGLAKQVFALRGGPRSLTRASSSRPGWA